MRSKYLISAASPLLLCVASPAFAQDVKTTAQEQPAAQDQSEETIVESDGTIVVTAGRIKGGVDTDVPPIAELSEGDIQATGATSLTELIASVAPQAGSGRGRGGGFPVILINGQRISSFREVRDITPEAVKQVQIFPEEVALKFGFRPDQRVVNVILKDSFAAFSVDAEYQVPQAGGQQRAELENSFFRIGKDYRLSIDVELEGSSGITENERNVLTTASAFPRSTLGNISAITPGGEISPALSTLAGQRVTVAGVPAGNTPNLAAFAANANRANSGDISTFRSLTSPSERLELNTSWTKSLGKQTTLSLNANFQQQDSRSLLGLAGASFVLPGTSPFSPFGQDVLVNRYFAGARPLQRDSAVQTANFGSSFNSLLGGFRWALTADYGRVEQNVRTTRNADFASLIAGVAAGTTNPFANDFGSNLQFLAPDLNNSISQAVNVKNTLSGMIFRLPAGEASLTLATGLTRQMLDGESIRSSTTTITALRRNVISQTANVDLPIFDRSPGSPGDVALNANFGLSDVSGFGSLIEYGVGLRWSPIPPISLQVSYIADENAPEIGQLGNPAQLTPNVAAYDFRNGTTQFIDVLSGGNAALVAESRRDIKVAINLTVPKPQGLGIQIEYFRNRSRNTTSAFPLLTSEIEAAFPGRVTRDGAGRLLAIDQRPVNFDTERSQRLRWGFNYSGIIGKAPQGMMGGFGGGGGRGGGGRPGGGGGRPGGGPGAGGGGGPPGGGFGNFMGGPQPTRWQIALYHSYKLEDQIIIAPGVPTLDLLGGSATGNFGGSPRHELELSGGIFLKGIGWRLEGNYRGGSFVRGSGLPGGSDLRFGDRISLNSFLFINLDQRGSLTKKIPLLKGSRIAVRIANFFNDYVDVRDASGTVPLSYQRGLIDPLGRQFEVSFRKRF